jgi:hypothetical protein
MLLAGRYRLEERLSERGGSSIWKAAEALAQGRRARPVHGGSGPPRVRWAARAGHGWGQRSRRARAAHSSGRLADVRERLVLAP